MVELIKELVAVIGPLVYGGWQGLMTLYVAWAVVKQFRTWQSEREARAQGKHNPSPEIHAAMDHALAPIRADLSEIRADVADVRDRVSRIEGHLNF